MTLPSSFLDLPLAHRGLHDLENGIAENSTKGCAAAIAVGYGIEIDVQLTRDGQAMVFHDYDLGRLTDESGPVAQHTAAELSEITLKGDGDPIPTLVDTLKQVAGKVPLLIEVKDQDGAMGPNVGPLEDAVVAALEGYPGPVAVMSFNPHSVAHFEKVAPHIPRGLVTCNWPAKNWPTVPENVRDTLRDIPDFDRTKSCFISHSKASLTNPAVTRIKAQGHAILCWTIKSPQQEAKAREIVDNITFEGYLA